MALTHKTLKGSNFYANLSKELIAFRGMNPRRITFQLMSSSLRRVPQFNQLKIRAKRLGFCGWAPGFSMFGYEALYLFQCGPG